MIPDKIAVFKSYHLGVDLLYQCDTCKTVHYILPNPDVHVMVVSWLRNSLH